jgi:hypothetical protein
MGVSVLYFISLWVETEIVVVGNKNIQSLEGK